MEAKSKSFRKLNAFQGGMVVVALLLLGRGAWGFAQGLHRPVIQELVLVAGCVLLGFLYLLLLDYLLQHARVALIALVMLGGYLIGMSPEFATGTGLALAYLTYESV